MKEPPLVFTRRRFLGGLAIVGTAPVWSQFDALAWAQSEGRFSGDDLELAHRLLFDPEQTLASGTPELDPARYDVLVIGGGIAGLTVAYRLRDRKLLLLERDPEVGGVSKCENWQGIEYASGAAYIIDPAADSEDPREAAGFALLEELGLRARGEDLERDRSRQRRLSGDANHVLFSNRKVLSESDAYSRSNRKFFEQVLDSDHYPSVPPTDKELVAALDRLSFAAFLRDKALQKRIYGKTVGKISPLGWEAIEYYCWGAFGTSATEASAYHGLNFFAAEYGDILVFPGGNGFISRRLGERIARHNPRAIRTGAWVLRIERDGDGWAATTWEKGILRRYRARCVVYASPLFLAPKLIPSLPASQRQAIATLDYRAYVVANVLLRRPANRVFPAAAFQDGYELTRVHGVDPFREGAEKLNGAKVFSDAILADFATDRHPSHAVLTVYRPYPYADGRAALMSASYAEIEAEVRREVLAGFAAHGLRAEDIEGVRLARWGHPMIITRPGQLIDGTLERATQPQPGLFYAHTDVTGSPAYENALAAAHDAVAAVEQHLRPS
ncbi:MAG TPA: FAD-dependent oxidoreductase [Vicinamibacteria bacterium]|nr:FAD-dependent oxidoreductase [Vicinamibacteria bacterium]